MPMKYESIEIRLARLDLKLPRQTAKKSIVFVFHKCGEQLSELSAKILFSFMRLLIPCGEAHTIFFSNR
jgi:hypothetical protein